MGFHRAATVLALLFMTACASGGGPQIRIFDGANNTSASAGKASTNGGNSQSTVNGVHTVQRGETLYAISRRYDVPLRALIVENGLSPPYELLVGQKISLPVARTHTVRAGETVYGISRQYGVAMNELVRVNHIQPPYTVKVGQKLAIPTLPPAQQTAAVEGASLPPPEPQASDAAPAPPPSLPKGQAQEPAPVAPVEPEEQVAFAPDGSIFPPAKPREPPRLVGPIPLPPGLTGDGFLWPVRGRILSNYGPKGKGLHNDGINITAPRGTPIRAAENGVVAYAGDELPGFGNIVLIKHRDGYVTAYAHAEKLLVTRGQLVKRGQVIAQVGSTGTVDTPQVHFQIRKGREAIDPRRLLLTS